MASKSAIARAAGVSRPTLYLYLTGGEFAVRPETAARIKAAIARLGEPAPVQPRRPVSAADDDLGALRARLERLSGGVHV